MGPGSDLLALWPGLRLSPFLDTFNYRVAGGSLLSENLAYMPFATRTSWACMRRLTLYS